MNKYARVETKWFLTLTILSLLCSIAGAVLRVFFSITSLLTLAMIIAGLPFFILFFVCYLASARSYLLIDDEKIVFPVTRVPKLTRKRNTVYYSDIARIEVRFFKGDFLSQTGDAFFYTFKMKDGSSFTETLYGYGKKHEAEIVTCLKRNVSFID